MELLFLVLFVILFVAPLLRIVAIKMEKQVVPKVVEVCPPHKWEAKQVFNYLGEEECHMTCLKCKKSPGN